VFNGTFCSDRGTCSADGVCTCNAGFTVRCPQPKLS
jgi:hypothetical protein